MKKGTPHSDTKMNFNSAQRHAAEKVRKKILKYGRIKEPDDKNSHVCVQVISVTLMLVDCPQPSQEKEKQEPAKKTNSTETPPGLAQVVGKDNSCIIP